MDFQQGAACSRRATVCLVLVSGLIYTHTAERSLVHRHHDTREEQSRSRVHDTYRDTTTHRHPSIIVSTVETPVRVDTNTLVAARHVPEPAQMPALACCALKSQHPLTPSPILSPKRSTPTTDLRICKDLKPGPCCIVLAIIPRTNHCERPVCGKDPPKALESCPLRSSEPCSNHPA